MYRASILFQPFLFLTDVIGYAAFFWKKFARMPEPKRILLIKLEHIGDVLLATPALRALRRRYPGAHIDILVREFSAPVLKGNRNVNRVIAWNAPWLSSGKRDSWASVGRMIRVLRRQKYDVAVDFHGDPRNILLAAKVAKYTAGFGARGFGFLLNKVVPYGRQHAIDRNLALVRALGARPAGRGMDIPVAAKPLPRGRWVCIAPGSGRPEKNWLPERWAAVADALIEEHSVSIVFTGSAGEARMVQDITDRMRHADKTLILCGKTTIAQLAGVIKQCALVLCPDSGTMHIARAVGTPCIGLFTVEDPAEWGYDEGVFRHVKGKDIRVSDVLDKVRSVGVRNRKIKE